MKTSYPASTPKRPALLSASPWDSWGAALCADDASYRSYWRLYNPAPHKNKLPATLIAMVAPPDKENTSLFVEIANILASHNLHSPAIFFHNEPEGLLILEDLGTLSYREEITQCSLNEEKLYGLFTDMQIKLHKDISKNVYKLPLYTEDIFFSETSLFFQWYWKNLNIPLPNTQDLNKFKQIHNSYLQEALDVPYSLVLRDAMIDNFIYCPQSTGIKQCGILDFQDALWGPVTYDMASMFLDARFDVPKHVIKQELSRYLKAQKCPDIKKFIRSFYMLSIQRNLKILGVFSRLYFRDHKSSYLQHIPRIWSWIDFALHQESFPYLKAWLDNYLPLKYRLIPDRSENKN